MHKLIMTGMFVCTFAMGFPAWAQQAPSTEEMIKALGPEGPSFSKSLTVEETGGLDDQQKRVVDEVRFGKAITVEVRERIAEAVEEAKLPKLDLSIYFDFDSALVNEQSVTTLMNLGRALSSDGLSGKSFLINGHTDAKGANDHNQQLSEARARSVVSFLADNFGIERTRLIALGFGETKLKNAGDPEAAENRRVEVVNLKY